MSRAFISKRSSVLIILLQRRLKKKRKQRKQKRKKQKTKNIGMYTSGFIIFRYDNGEEKKVVAESSKKSQLQ
jgi:hypothetical protein